MEKYDFRMEMKDCYQASARSVVEVDVPALNFLMIDGRGDPNTSPVVAAAVEALFMVSYAAKFIIKKSAAGVDYAVMPLEALWWVDDMARFSVGDKANWEWTTMIMQPPFVSRAVIERAILEAQARRNTAALSSLRFESFAEGRCAQVLHRGPFSEEGPTVERLHAFVDAHGQRVGKHHEIYLSDLRKAAPARWKTIIRQPML